ncbi:MAG TPA: sodium:solute symporter family protein [Thermoanaerobaculia bacterium]|nr:sodium:solute symporter family protein [Thermoanaerobaculia bacterium]
MSLTGIDFAIIALYFAIIVPLGLFFARRAKRSMLDYFISDRSMPWWLAGTAMVATTFSADTPLAVTEMVVKNGVAGNWLWWSMLASGMLTVFFFSRLWRRAEIVTDVELTELRYSGKPAAFLRGFRAAYLGLLVNVIVMGWVNLGMAKVMSGMLGIEKWTALLILLFITFVYTATSGYWGVAVTNGIQYLFEMGGAIVLAVVAVQAVGGMDVLKEKVGAAQPAGGGGVTFGSSEAVLAFWPSGDGVWVLPAITLAALLGLNWWASWYPGSEPGGGGYVVQNMLACKTEKDAQWAALLFNIAHYAIRSWPWVITALCTLVLYGGAVRDAAGNEDPGGNYVRVMVDLLPAGLRGFMVASFIAAYTSTIATQMNWGSSFLINDLYRRFMRREAPERHYVFAARVATALILVLSLIVTAFMNQVHHAWQFLLMLGAGAGLVYILRWYWWRVNAWSEVSAMGAALVTSLGLHFFLDATTARGFALNLIITTSVTTIVWLSVTFATPPEPQEKLRSFYAKVRPSGPGWNTVAAELGLEPLRGELRRNAVAWVLGVAMVYSIMFGTGALLFGQREKLMIFSIIAAASGASLVMVMRSREDREVA